jgi:Flp pilus assembly protein TadD
MVAGDPVLISSQGGINLYIGNNPTSDGLSAALPEPMGHNWRIKQITHLAEVAEQRVLKPGEVSAYWQKLATEWIRAHPTDFAALTLKKLIFLFANREIPNERSIDSHYAEFAILGYNPFVFGLILPPALLGIVVLWRRKPGVRFLVAAMAVFMAGLLLFFVNSRFRLPLMPLYCLLAAGGLAWIWNSARKRSWLPVATVVPMLIVGWLSFDPPVKYPDNWSVQNLASRGLYLYARGQWREAAEVFRVAAELQPDFPEVHLNLGAAYLRLGRTDSARACFERETRLHPTRFKAYQNLGSIYLLEKDYKQAVQQAEIAIGLAPYDVLSHLVRLRALGEDPEVDNLRLARAVDEAAGSTDDDLEVLNEGGGLLLAREKTSDIAISILQRAETARPPAIETDDDAFGPEFTHGRADFERRRGTSFHLLGYACVYARRLDEGVEYCRRAIAADSTLVPAYLNLSTAYWLQGKSKDADSLLTETTRRFPDNPLVREALQRLR